LAIQTTKMKTTKTNKWETLGQKPPRIAEGIPPKLGESYRLYTIQVGETLTARGVAFVILI